MPEHVPLAENQDQIVETLVAQGNAVFAEPYVRYPFSGIEPADDLLNDLENYSHFYTLACCMDRQIRAERAWTIPYYISLEIGGPDFENFHNTQLTDFQRIFRDRNLHRFNDVMSGVFHAAVVRIHDQYQDNAANIWNDNPASATLIRRFMEFQGVGVKIASMAANILARTFKIPMEDIRNIDVSPDVQVKRVFSMLGLISQDADNEALIDRAREINPEYPGVFDFPVWEIGRQHCRPQNPSCNACPLTALCPRMM